MSLAVADKLLRAFEALKNFKDGTAISESNAASTAKKKEATLSKKDRISNLNVIGDLTCSPLLRNLSEFGKLIAVSIETLLSFCDDEESDVRLVAGDCVNRIIKGFMDATVGRVHVELYKEIKKNGNSRCLRAALSKFAEICHLIRPHKCRPFITNLLPCLARICTREEEPVQETLATAMKRMMPVLGAFMNDKETKILLKTFLQNVSSTSATTRRTAASSITMICLHARKPELFYSWVINILLESMLPFSVDQNSPTYCGVLQCLRHIVPHLGNEEQENELVMRGSFGVIHQQKRRGNEEMLEKEEKQLLQMYKLIMLSTKHSDHNVVTAGLEVLQHLLQSPPRKLLYQLLSQQGLAAFSANQDGSDGLFGTTLDDIDTLSFTSQPDSGIEEPLGEMGVDGASEKVGENGTSVEDIQELRRHFSQPEDEASETLTDTVSEISDDGTEGSSSLDTDNSSMLGHHRSGSSTSGIVTQASSTDELNRIETEQDMIAKDDQESELEQEGNEGVDEGFNIDPVVCKGVPILHCARVMCSFLLSGKNGEILSDRLVRVSVKSLALNCLAAIFRIHPQTFLMRVVPEVGGEGIDDDGNQQLIREVLLYQGHHDPIIRGSLALLLGNVLQSSLIRSRYDFEAWSVEICEECKTDRVNIDVLVNVLETLVLDDTSVTVRWACLGIKECLPALCVSSYTGLTLQLCLKLVHLKQNSYWLVKVELLHIIGNLNFSLIAYLERQASYLSLEQSNKLSCNLQQTFFHNVVLELLADNDPRVRSEATKTIVKLVQNMFYENNCLSKEPLLAVAKESLGKTFGSSSNNENSVIKTNLAKVVTSLSEKLNVAISKHALLGYCEALSVLSKSYPVPSWPVCWLCDVHAITRSPSPTGKTGFTGNMFPPVAPPTEPHVSSILCNNGGGSLSFIVELMTSSWLTFNLHAHEDALLLSGNLLLGIASSSMSLGQSNVNPTESSGKWSVFADPEISVLADKVFAHILRLLNICFHVIDNVTPGAHSAKSSLLSKDKDKTPAPIPGAAVPTSNTAATSATNVSSPKKLLNRSLRKTEASEGANVGVEKGSAGKSSENEGKSSTPGAPLGQFHHLPHYYQLYEVVKGVFSNYKVNLKFSDDDKFVKLLKTTLTVFAMLLELVTFSDIGKNVEEIIGYLQATVKCEAATTFLCVQQMLRAIFGVNVATQPENSSSNTSQQKDALITEVLLPPCLEVLSKDYGDVGFYQSYYEDFQQEISRSFEEIRKSDQTKESSRSFKDFGFIKRLRQRRGSFRPPIKVDKQVHVHSYIRMFEPLVIQALKDYTSSSDIQVQAQVLSILVQLIRLRVNYALLDSEQAFLNFVLKQFEFIQAGQIRHIEAFSPHMFQFLILLSYECFQPKFNQAKSVFGMSRIIQVCDDIMACGQSSRTHAIPALCPIVYDLFDTQATGRNEDSKELETQREVFVSMLLRLTQFPEVLSLLVYVLTFYRKNDEKWKKFSRQAVDITLQMLIKQQVMIDDIDGLKCLESLFDSVAPIALRPLDVILKAIFAPANLPNALLKKRWLSQVIVLLKVIVTQNTEENLLSRVTQLGLTGGLIGNIVDDEELDTSDVISESNPAKVMVYFLFHALYLAVKSSSAVSESQDKESIGLISQLTSHLLLYMQEIIRSGLFKSINGAGSSIIKENLLNEPSSQAVDTKIKKIHEMFISLKETQPVLFLQWLQLVFLFGFHDEDWWITLQDRMTRQDRCSVNGHIVLKGTFLVRCKILSAQLKNAENTSTFQSFVKENLINIVEMSNEPPVKMLLRQIHSSSTCSQVFIDVTKELCQIKLTSKPTLEFRKNLLVILDDLHYKQSNSLIQLLVTEFLDSHYRAITRKCETMICSRLEYCMSLPKEEFGEFFSAEDIKSIHNSLVDIGVTKRNPRLASLISHITPESYDVPTVENTIDCKAAITAIKTKRTSEVNWFYSFVYNCCCYWKMNDVGIKSFTEVVHLLHALSFHEISQIMDDENFNTSMLSPCLTFGIRKTIEIYSRKFDHEAPGNPFEDTAYFDSYGVDHLFQCAFGLLLRHVQEIVFSVTTFDENQQQTQDPLKSEFSFVQSTMNSSQINELSKNFKWKQKLLDITKGLDVYLSFLDKLPTAAQLPEAIYCGVCQFGMIALEVLCIENRHCNHCCTSELSTVLRCFSRMLHSRHLYFVLNSTEYSSWVSHALRSVNCLVSTVFVQPGTTLPEDTAYSDLADSEIPLKQASMLVNYLYTLLNHADHHSSVPDTLTRSFHDVITGLSRLTIFNSYVRIPPLVWKMGWGDDDHGSELPPLPIDILREKDVLQDFVLRVHSIGWISRQQFEETWAALLGVLSSPLSPEQTSREEDMDSIKSGCLALQCITALLLQTTLCPLPGNPSVGTNFHTSRQKELPFLDSRAGRKLCAVRRIVEDHFIQQSPKSSTWQTGIDTGDFYGGNIERVSGLHSYSLGQICVNALQIQCISVDSNEHDETNTTSAPTVSAQDKIDVRSCVQFLMELFEQWVSPYTQPKTPLMLLTQSVKSLLIISDLFVDSAQYEWMLSELLDLYQNFPNEDEIMMQYLLPALCKALAVLKMEGVIPEKVVKMIEAAFKAPHVPLQVSGLYGALYLLESHMSSVVNLVIPLVTDYVMKTLPQVTDSSVFGEHRLLVLLSTSFYLLEHYDNEITDVDFKQNFLKAVTAMASSGDENIPLQLYHAIIRGLERLVVSFSLSSEDNDSLVKFSVDRLAIRNPQKAISALGLLLTCMYTGKEGDRPSGLFQENETVDTPTDDILLVALERVTALFDRIRKGFRSEAKLVSEILPTVLGDFFPPTDMMNKVIGEFLSSQQPHPELMASVLFKVCEQLITKGQQSSVKDWILLSLSSFTQRPPLGMAIWSFTCIFIAASTNKWIRALFHHVVSRIGKLENFDRTYFLITATDFYHNQNLTEDEKKSFLTTFENVAQTGTPYADLIQNIV